MQVTTAGTAYNGEARGRETRGRLGHGQHPHHCDRQ
jgi:hypothetical protein